MIGDCALCQKTNKLCESHIIPELFYRPLYDPKHRFRAIHSSSPTIKYHQKGIKEYLLCHDCEQNLSRYENYVGGIFANLYPKIKKMNVGEILNFSIDFKKSRLFYLSVLWRMSVATHKNFQNFAMPKHNEKLRSLILSEDPGNTTEFGCVVSIPLINGLFKIDWFLDPHNAKMRGDDICFVVFGGILYMFFITFNHNPKVYSEAFIQKNNSWLITIQDARKVPFVDRAFRAGQQVLLKKVPK